MLMKKLYNNETTWYVLCSHVHIETNHQYDIKGENVVNILITLFERTLSVTFVKFHPTHDHIYF